MRIFDKDNKINFVDENNVFVGYDSEVNCCEEFGWFILDTIYDSKTNTFDTLIKDDYTTLCGWLFDTSYYKVLIVDIKQEIQHMALFKLKKDNKELFLHLYNLHNGHYCHGFTFGKNDRTYYNGDL